MLIITLVLLVVLVMVLAALMIALMALMIAFVALVILIVFLREQFIQLFLTWALVYMITDCMTSFNMIKLLTTSKTFYDFNMQIK